jgi:UDP-2,4-diacetamido-2,4,6-trideoxy-beta-L-altropyranose hydrolase
MNILIRTNSSKQIGMGHLIRCMSLAIVLKEKGARVIFVINDGNDNRIEVLQKNHFEVYPINISNDIEQTIDILKNLNLKIQWVIVDHYGIDKNWHLKIREWAQKIMVIDDLADRAHDCDLLVDQNYYYNQFMRYHSLVSSHTECLLGPDFALLRKEFQQLRAQLKNRDGRIKKILIFFGGSDCSTAIIKALEACLTLPQYHFEIEVVTTSVCTRQENIQQLCQEIGARYLYQVDNIAELMSKTDLVIGGGGVSIWERCCLGLPSIVLSIADNQVLVSKAAASLGLICYLGQLEDVDKTEIANAIISLFSDPQSVINMSLKGSHLVDGRGCEKIAAKLYQ